MKNTKNFLFTALFATLLSVNALAQDDIVIVTDDDSTPADTGTTGGGNYDGSLPPGVTDARACNQVDQSEVACAMVYDSGMGFSTCNLGVIGNGSADFNSAGAQTCAALKSCEIVAGTYYEFENGTWTEKSSCSYNGGGGGTSPSAGEGKGGRGGKGGKGGKGPRR